MIKKIFKYLSLALVFLLVAGFFLVQGGGTSNQQLKNVATPATINDVVDLSSSNLTVSAQGLSTSVNLNENQLATFVKLVLGDNLGQAGDMAIGLDKDQIRMEMPVKFSVVNSKAILYGKPKLENESLVIDVTQTKLGNARNTNTCPHGQTSETTGSAPYTDIAAPSIHRQAKRHRFSIPCRGHCAPLWYGSRRKHTAWFSPP